MMKTNTLGEVRVCSSRSNFKVYLLALIILPLFSPISYSDTLRQALENSYNNSDKLLLERMSVKQADESVAKAVAAKRFNLSASQKVSSGYNYSAACGGFCNSNSVGTSLSASMSVLDGGRADIKIIIATKELIAKRIGLIEIEQDVLLSAVKAYMDMRRSLEFVALEENSVRLLEKEVQAAQDRFEVGEITKTDISFAESRLEAAKGKLASQIGNLEIATEAYQMVIGIAPKELKDPPPTPDLPQTLNLAKLAAAKNHPTLRALKHAVEIADLKLDLTRANYKPTFSLAGEITDSSQTSKLSSNLSFGGRVVLYQGGDRSSEERKALIAVEKARSNLIYQTRRIEQAVATRWSELNIARALIVANNKQIRAAETAYRGVRDEAEFGLRTTLDILDAEQSLMAAKVQLASTRRDEYVAAYELLKSVGMLTVSNLGLDVEEYNATNNYELVKDAPRKNQFFKFDKLLKRFGQ